MVKIIEWKKENIKYRKKEMEIRIEGETTEDIWRNLKESVEKCVIRKQVKIKIGERDWWDTECKKEKKKVKKAYKRWRQGKEGKEEYILLRKNFRELCKRKEAAKLEKLEEEIKRARAEAQIWKIVNRERKNARIVEEDISIEEWRRHFVSVLEGREEDGRGKTGKRSLEDDQEEELNDEEIEKQIRKMKRKKAAGADGTEGEAWIYSRKKIRTKLKEVAGRKGRGTMDNIYVLNHIIQKEIRKKGGKIFGFFMDLKSAFDKVDRKTLWEEMERRGIRKGIVERIKKIYESTKNVVRVNGRVSERFSDGKRNETGLLAKSNPVLAADSRYRRRNEKRSSRGNTGGWRIWSLAYADDLVIMAKSEEGMKEMLKRMEKYLKRKKLYVNIKKSKMVCFRSEGGRKRRIEWKWEGQNIEEVKEFKYLGYVVKENGGQEGQIKESKKKGNIVLKQVWGLGERRFRDDFKRRIKLFRYLILGVIMYGAEVWEWKEREELERIQKRYIKCTLNSTLAHRIM